MSRMIHCVKLQREAEGLDYAPWPGELGQRIYAEISREAWQHWLAYQTKLINENRINPLDPQARKFLADQMRAFLFGGDATMPAGFVAPQSH